MELIIYSSVSSEFLLVTNLTWITCSSICAIVLCFCTFCHRLPLFVHWRCLELQMWIIGSSSDQSQVWRSFHWSDSHRLASENKNRISHNVDLIIFSLHQLFWMLKYQWRRVLTSRRASLANKFFSQCRVASFSSNSHTRITAREHDNWQSFWGLLGSSGPGHRCYDESGQPVVILRLFFSHRTESVGRISELWFGSELERCG